LRPPLKPRARRVCFFCLVQRRLPPHVPVYTATRNASTRKPPVCRIVAPFPSLQRWKQPAARFLWVVLCANALPTAQPWLGRLRGSAPERQLLLDVGRSLADFLPGDTAACHLLAYCGQSSSLRMRCSTTLLQPIPRVDTIPA